MKGAAKCDKHAEQQNFVNQQGLECALCLWGIPEGLPASASIFNIPEAMPWLSHAWLVHALCVTAAMPLTHVMDSLSACLLHPIEDRCLVECMWLVPGLSF